MLLNNFYKIIEQVEICESNVAVDEPVKKFRFSIKLNPDHPVYKGHFPGNPVVPGVCQVQIIKELTSAVLKKDLVIHKSDNIKFISMIIPSVSPLLNVNLEIKEKEAGFWQVTGVILNESQVFLKFKGLLGHD
jgi:3-hydroxyacyl-[acyl-carrier-protein] dehydratase